MFLRVRGFSDFRFCVFCGLRFGGFRVFRVFWVVVFRDSRV